MEVLGPIFNIAKTVYQLCETAESNKKQCKRLKYRITLLLLPAQCLHTQPEKSRELESVLKELKVVLENAQCWAFKYSKMAWWKKLMRSGHIKEEFEHVNDRLGDMAESLQILLIVEKRSEFMEHFKESRRKAQNLQAVEEDIAELTQSFQSGMHLMANTVDNLSSWIEQQKMIVYQGISLSWDITEIRPTDLKRGELLDETRHHSLYRGEYHKGPVAIKVLKGDLKTDNDYIRREFQSDCKTMKKFECRNILRLFGICIDNSKSEPCYSLVMEFCEKGTLRDLLNRERGLPWEQRVSMVLDAARALYRLHHSEMKAILHGHLSSSKFLVDGTYCLKLYEFQFSKTESSMRRTLPTEKQNIGWAYMAPETLNNLNAYNKRSEVYSLGVVFYEIASGKVPLEGLTDPEKHLDELHQMLTAEVATGLPTDCPKILSDIITQSLESHPTKRPTAGVIVDQLHAYLNEENPRLLPAETNI
ncbi:mixed lineage kinase domain-like protein [Pelobates fuscus]|uniref:mixed lineage kinase domain-like protein n=1 Tax=Pelobates fuscus TaxID=191477 RepID=UPI002FE4C9DB